MQKFKVTREEIRKWFNTLPSKDLGWIIPETAILEGELLEGGTVKKCVPSDIMLMSNPPSYKCKNCGQTWRNNEPTPFCQLGHKCTDGVACNCPTVEKCCSKCYEVVGRASREICGNILCPCLNKKEERCPVCLAIPCYCKLSNIQQSNDLNRETPKEVTEEEVKLPKNIKIQPWNIYPEGSWQMNVSGLGQKLNEVIDYLRASKEKK